MQKRMLTISILPIHTFYVVTLFELCRISMITKEWDNEQINTLFSLSVVSPVDRIKVVKQISDQIIADFLEREKRSKLLDPDMYPVSEQLKVWVWMGKYNLIRDV